MKYPRRSLRGVVTGSYHRPAFEVSLGTSAMLEGDVVLRVHI
jgi:hypothetical protein